MGTKRIAICSKLIYIIKIEISLILKDILRVSQRPMDCIVRDYVDLERSMMHNHQGKYIFLEGATGLNLFETKSLRKEKQHPITGRDLKSEEISYIKFHDKCYRETHGMLLTESSLACFFSWYEKMRSTGTSLDGLRNSRDWTHAYSIVRYYLTATDFQSHFVNFNPIHSNKYAFERDLAENALRARKDIGTWLIRHSSRNRPACNEEWERLQRFGIRYYALSFIGQDCEIKHTLIVCKIGSGWYAADRWHTNFTEALEATLVRNNLSFTQRITGYITP